MPLAVLCTLVAALLGAGNAGGEIRVAVLGTEGAGGKAALAGAEAARDDLARAGGPKVVVVPLALASPWAGAAGPIARLIFEERISVLIEAGDGALAHVAAQVATRSRVPLVTLSPETSITAIHDPWLLRIVPSDREQALALIDWALPEPAGARAKLVVPGGREGRERLAALESVCH